MKRNFTVIFIICFMFSANLAFSAEVDVAPNVPDALFNAITAASAGDVLILASGGVYPNTQTMTVTVPLTIKTADGFAAKAILVKASGASGYPSNMFQVDASLTLKNIICMGRAGTNPAGGSWLSRGQVTKIEVDGCEVTRFNFVSQGAALDTLIVTNCLFNGNLVNAGSWGGTWDFQGDAIKYIRMQNNTFMYCIFGPLLGNGWGNYIASTISEVIIDHNTIYHISGAHGPTTMFSRAENVKFTNNLYINGSYRPQESFSNKWIDFPQNTEIGKLDESNQYWGVITHTGPSGIWLMSLEMVDSASTVMDMHANNIYWTSDVTDMWASKGIQKPYIWSNETEAAIVDPANAYFEEELTFVNAPESYMPAWENVADSCVKMQAHPELYANPPSPYGGWAYYDGDGNALYDLRTRANIDMAYNTSATSYTAGDKGLPLGDLNWFPDKKQEWLTSVSMRESADRPDNFELAQNYPNPFNPGTTIYYSLKKTADVNLTIYNTLGQPVKTLVDGKINAGSHSEQWDGTNATGVKVVSGIYYYRLEAENQSKTMKMLLMK